MSCDIILVTSESFYDESLNLNKAYFPKMLKHKTLHQPHGLFMLQYFDLKQLLSDTGDVTEQTGFLTGSDSVTIHDYSNYSVQFRFALCDF